MTLDLKSVPFDERTVYALERIATVIEQWVLEHPGDAKEAGFLTGEPPLPTPPPDLPMVPIMQPLPPVTPPFTFTPNLACPVHHVPWKQVPAGVSKRTGAAYGAFLACPERDCSQRPPQ